MRGKCVESRGMPGAYTPLVRCAKAIPLVGILSFVGCESTVTIASGPPPEVPWTVVFAEHASPYAGPTPVIGGPCLQSALPSDSEGRCGCVIITATTDPLGPGHCAAPGRVPIPDSDAQALKAVKADASWLGNLAMQTGSEANNFCELTQLPGSPTDSTSPRYLCENAFNAILGPPAGWCYIDPTADPPLGGQDQLMKLCPGATGLIRLSGVPSQQVATAEGLFIVCPTG